MILTLYNIITVPWLIRLTMVWPLPCAWLVWMACVDIGQQQVDMENHWHFNFITCRHFYYALSSTHTLFWVCTFLTCNYISFCNILYTLMEKLTEYY